MKSDKKLPDSEESLGFFAYYPQKVAVGFGLVIAFALVGNFAGHREASVVMTIITVVMWACTRIITEAIAGWRTISEGHAAAKEKKVQKPKKKDSEDDV